MKVLGQPGSSVLVTQGPLVGGGMGAFALVQSDLRRRVEGNYTWLLGELYGLVGKGLTNTCHIFQGLKRPMLVNGNGSADKVKLVYVWKPQYDYRFSGQQFGNDSSLERVAAPAGRVFAVLISPNSMKETYPEVHGWIEHWTWIHEDPTAPGKPIDYETRYDACIWTKNEQ
jgi:hypothetical protein